MWWLKTSMCPLAMLPSWYQIPVLYTILISHTLLWYFPLPAHTFPSRSFDIMLFYHACTAQLPAAFPSFICFVHLSSLVSTLFSPLLSSSIKPYNVFINMSYPVPFQRQLFVFGVRAFTIPFTFITLYSDSFCPQNNIITTLFLMLQDYIVFLKATLLQKPQNHQNYCWRTINKKKLQ